MGEVSKEFMCNCGCGKLLSECEMECGKTLRKIIYGKIQEGMDDSIRGHPGRRVPGRFNPHQMDKKTHR